MLRTRIAVCLQGALVLILHALHVHMQVADAHVSPVNFLLQLLDFRLHLLTECRSQA